MSDKKIQKHVYLTPNNVEVLDEVIENKRGINNYSEAIRYVIDVYSKQLAEEDSKVNQRKINALSKNVDILIELVAGGLHAQGIKAISPSETSYVYEDAKRFVEEDIQKAVTRRSNPKKANYVTKEKESQLEVTKNIFNRRPF